MLIDFHTHVFPEKIARQTIDFLASKSQNKPFTDGTVEGMLGALNRADADIAVALPVLTKPTQFDSVIKFACLVNENFSSGNKKIISFAAISERAIAAMPSKNATIRSCFALFLASR